MIFVILQSGLIYRIRADPFNFVHGIRVGLQQNIRTLGLEGSIGTEGKRAQWAERFKK